MLLICFSLGDENYALPAQRIEAITAHVHCQRIPLTPPWFSGLMMYHTRPVPVIDLCYMAHQQPAQQHLGTRIMVMSVPYQQQTRRIGLLAEQVTHTRRSSQLQFEDLGIQMKDSPWLGQVAYDDGSLIQMLEPEALWTDELCQLLFDIESVEAQ